MASFRKRGKTWTATIDRVGLKPEHKTFASKQLAEGWARAREHELLAAKRGQIIPHTVKEALERYAREVSPQHRGARWESVRLTKLVREIPFAKRFLSDVTAADIAGWRDKSLRSLASASVRREMVILRGVFEIARKEWGWLSVNPMTEVTWPSPGRARDRRISEDEIDRILLALNYERGAVAKTMSQRIAVAFLWALETAMRSGEMVRLRWVDVRTEARFARLPKTKNDDARDVSLSKAALRLLKCLPVDGELVFSLTDASRDALFRKARKAAKIPDLHFHDTRHEAITRLARKLDVLDLARMIGHRDLRSLQVYYNPTATEIAERLD